jgi:hypothetical protein
VLRRLTDVVAAAWQSDAQRQAGAFLEGGVFAALAYGEEQEKLRDLGTAFKHAADEQQAWDIITWGFGSLPARNAWRLARDGLSEAGGLVGPGGVDLGEFLAQPESGPPQAQFAVIAAMVPRLVAAGVLPDPGDSLFGGLGADAAQAYVAGLEAPPTDPDRLHAQTPWELWQSLLDQTDVGFNRVGGPLGVVAGG